MEPVLLVNAHSYRRLYPVEDRKLAACSAFGEIVDSQIWQFNHEELSCQKHDFKLFLNKDGDGYVLTKAKVLGDGKNKVFEEDRVYARSSRRDHGADDGHWCQDEQDVGFWSDYVRPEDEGKWTEAVWPDHRWYLYGYTDPFSTTTLALKLNKLRNFEQCLTETFQNVDDHWEFEKGWKRNREDQCYTEHNVRFCEQEQCLIIEARRGEPTQPLPEDPDAHNYPEHGGGWTSASLISKFSFTFGLLEVEAKIDARTPFWPAIWTEGAHNMDGAGWPHRGEIDIMEYYCEHILANVFRGQDFPKNNEFGPKHEGKSFKVDQFPKNYFQEYRTWRMLWDNSSLMVWLEDYLLMQVSVDKLTNPSGSNPMRMPHRLRLNLAVGGKCGGDPSNCHESSKFCLKAVRLWSDHFFPDHNAHDIQ